VKASLFAFRRYITDSDSLKTFLDKKLGRPRRVHSKKEIVTRRGIVLFQGVKSLHGKSHWDLWDGTTTADTMGDHFTESESIHLYELPHDV
jgi:hypothetical protein